jgi:arylsulfatase A
MGNWKAIRLGANKNANAPVQLYDLAADPAESKDVAAQNEEVVAKARLLMTSSRSPSRVPRWNFPATP